MWSRMHSHPVVAHVPEGQALGRRNGRPMGSIAGQQDRPGITRRASPPTHIHQEAHNSPHHLVAEGICSNIEYDKPTVHGRPLRGEQITMTRSDGLTLALQWLSTEGSEILFAIQRITGQIHQRDRQGFSHMPRTINQHWLWFPCVHHCVFVLAPRCAVTSVEIITYPLRI